MKRQWDLSSSILFGFETNEEGLLSGSKLDSILKAFRNATTARRVPATSASEHSPVARSSLKGKQKFDPGLSGLRGAASFGVVLFHATIYFGYPLKALTNTFYLGVPIFLMMSMYLLLKRLEGPLLLEFSL